ncbi:hypothetical protein Tco_0723289, partial [Tanacetum coccineum]
IHHPRPRRWFKTYESLNDGSILHMGNESTALVHGRGCVDLSILEKALVPRPGQRSLINGTEDIDGPVVPEEVTEVFQDVAFWKEVINDEMDSIMGNNTWVLADLPPVLERYTDASWISNTEDNSSTSGWVFWLGGAADNEVEWLRNLILEIPLWSKPITPISIRYDSATTLAKPYSQMYNRKSRHLGVRHSMIRELITNGVVSIEFVRSQRNLVDHVTKGLA